MFPGYLLVLFGLLYSSVIIQPYASPFDVIEESQQGTIISGVAEYLKQVMLVIAEMPNSTTYQLMGDDPFSKSFTINPKTGELQVVGRIDREILCKPETTNRNKPEIELDCLKELNVLITPHGVRGTQETPTLKTITLRIVDINDNPPNWPGKGMLAVKFVETSQFSSFFGRQETNLQQLLEPAVDPDAGLNGTIKYMLEGNGADKFRLEQTDPEYSRYENQGTNSLLSLKPIAPLDREEFESYNMTLIAYDGGKPPRSASILLKVYITDVNDNAPVFHPSSYPRDNKPSRLTRVHLMETTGIGSEVIRFNATDKDAGENARITYSIFPSDVALVQKYFDLDPINGFLRVKEKLDYDSGEREFKFKVGHHFFKVL